MIREESRPQHKLIKNNQTEYGKVEDDSGGNGQEQLTPRAG